MKTCYTIDDLAFPIKLQQRGKDNFTVIYGKQVDAELTYEQACSKLGQAIMHALACDSKLDGSKIDDIRRNDCRHVERRDGQATTTTVKNLKSS